MGVTVESPVHSLVNLGYHQAPLPTSRLIGSDMRHYMRPPLVPESIQIAKQSPNPKREEKEEEEKIITELQVMEVVENRTGGQYSCGEEEDDDDEEEVMENWNFPEDEVEEYGVDPKDVGTVDSWIKRHPHLIRLTGRHPLNCEPPLPLLMQYGFLTPPSLHYVRNHGPVPQVPVASAPDDWIIQVTGLVRRPQSLSLRQLLHEFKPRQLPVTLVCAGNRRKEQNAVKQTIGFNWGPGAIGTSVWRGARLCDVLRRCGIYSKKKGGLYVSFEGKETLPAAGGTKYGTSISVDIAMDETRDVLLAYMQNGKPLEPDHGFPVRMIIPGFIGGRMVKWLARIHVSDHESDGHYHYKDNRVLPADVDADTANAQGLWFKPEYLINELNINSVISTPSHGEFLPINAAALLAPYTVKGYAYSGGGRKVGRVEVTIDGGQTWMQCEIQRPEKPTKYGKHWCWCFWSVDIELIELMQAKELAVRAWDESMNTQPQNLTWNVMGMMNNCWFLVRLSSCRSKDGGLGLVFEHPTRPGNQTGGWMISASSEDKKSGGLKAAKSTITKSLSSPFLGQNVRQITMAEVRKHSTPESPWIVVNNKVYDCKKFLKEHPGGMDSILISAGTDCTEEFEAIHSDKAKLLIEDFYIGELASYGSSVSANSSPDNSVHGGMSIDRSSSSSSLAMFPISEVSPSPPVALNPKQRIDCTLIEKRVVSKDTRVFRFALPSPDQILGLPVGKHIFVSSKVDGKLCMRAYTPIKSSEEDVGYFELLVKIYYKDSHPQFPQGGAMSQHLDSLKLGDSIGVKGPIGHIEYKGRGHVHIEGKPKFMKRCSMIAGGTGITPIYQFIKAILKDPEDATEMHLVYANRTEDDILLREELDAWARDYPGRFSVWYVIGKASREDWRYSEGHITEEILRNNLPPGDVETMAFMCGPPPMIQFACLPNLDKLGYHKNMCFQF